MTVLFRLFRAPALPFLLPFPLGDVFTLLVVGPLVLTHLLSPTHMLFLSSLKRFRLLRVRPTERPLSVRPTIQPAQQVLKVTLLPPRDSVRVLLVLHADAEHVQLLRRLDRSRTPLSGRTQTLRCVPSKFREVGLSEATGICFTNEGEEWKSCSEKACESVKGMLYHQPTRGYGGPCQFAAWLSYPKDPCCGQTRDSSDEKLRIVLTNQF